MNRCIRNQIESVMRLIFPVLSFLAASTLVAAIPLQGNPDCGKAQGEWHEATQQPGGQPITCAEDCTEFWNFTDQGWRDACGAPASGDPNKFCTSDANPTQVEENVIDRTCIDNKCETVGSERFVTNHDNHANATGNCN